MKADNGLRQPPICPSCRQRCGKFVCPCCGGHTPFPWKCEACTPHNSPCMMNFQPTRNRDTLIGCLIVVASVVVMALLLLWILQAVTS